MAVSAASAVTLVLTSMGHPSSLLEVLFPKETASRQSSSESGTKLSVVVVAASLGVDTGALPN